MRFIKKKNHTNIKIVLFYEMSIPLWLHSFVQLVFYENNDIFSYELKIKVVYEILRIFLFRRHFSVESLDYFM